MKTFFIILVMACYLLNVYKSGIRLYKDEYLKNIKKAYDNMSREELYKSMVKAGEIFDKIAVYFSGFLFILGIITFMVG